ncbi:hypothetical protein AB6A40_004882 [Gnathostoma spinigerum]|uniref:NAD(+) kinase n=1 Tax=Gnathostoma spinigerum TaxID=75299 RepID=A0ABD6EDT9_9BILA
MWKCYPFTFLRHRVLFSSNVFHSLMGTRAEVTKILMNSLSSKTTRTVSHEDAFNPRKVLILSKTSRLEFEKRGHPNWDDDQLFTFLKERGSDVDRLRERHNSHYSYLKEIQSQLSSAGIETRTVHREDYTMEAIRWADAIFSAGGDGTFLRAASCVRDRNKPVIGINTDPEGSEGCLCLTKKQSRETFETSLRKMLNGEFEWLYRQRIRISLTGATSRTERIIVDAGLVPNRIHEPSFETDVDLEISERGDISDSESRLPELALNEIFIGESVASRVSYYEVQFDKMQPVRQKSSGITVCTGSGSTSWYYNTSRTTKKNVSKLMEIVSSQLSIELPFKDDGFVGRICDEFNNSLIFPPDCPVMAYSIRDPIFNNTFPSVETRGFISTVKIRSRCYDAYLVIDGVVAYRFNDGTGVHLSMHSEDALKTIRLSS